MVFKLNLMVIQDELHTFLSNAEEGMVNGETRTYLVWEYYSIANNDNHHSCHLTVEKNVAGHLEYEIIVSDNGQIYMVQSKDVRSLVTQLQKTLPFECVYRNQMEEEGLDDGVGILINSLWDYIEEEE